MISLLAVLPIISASVTGVIGLFFFLLYERKPQYLFYLKFAVTCFFVFGYAITSIGLYNSGNAEEAVTWRRLQTSALSLVTVFYLDYIIKYIDYKRPVLFRSAQFTAIICIVIQFFVNSSFSWKISSNEKITLKIFSTTTVYYALSPGIITIILLGFGLVVYFAVFLITYQQRSQIPDRKKNFIYLAVLIFYSGFMNDTLISFGLIQSIFLLSPSLMLLIILTAYSMTDTILEDARLKSKLEEANRKSEILTSELQSTNAQLEDKLTSIRALQTNLKEMATRDFLTGLLNRRLLTETLEHEMFRAKRQQSTSLVMIDIDHFKIINDTYGHRAGDETLIWISNLLKSHFRQGDLVFRYGGEEFLVILPGVRMVDAWKRTDELRLIIMDTIIRYENLEMTVTISAGVTEIVEGDVLSETALKICDLALYKAKTGGRNRVESASIPPIERLKR